MSSHREAPEISKDPVADNTDTYAFVSPDNPSTVTLITNYIPAEVPAGGPNFFEFGNDILYAINIDNDGDGLADISYEFSFESTITNPDTFLYNTGPIGSLTDSSWNLRQSYTVKRIDYTGGCRRGDEGKVTVLGTGLACPPCNVGPRSTPNYAKLGEEAVHSLPGGQTVFAGQRNDPFFVDIGSIFDLGDLRPIQNLHLIPTAAAPRRGYARDAQRPLDRDPDPDYETDERWLDANERAESKGGDRRLGLGKPSQAPHVRRRASGTLRGRPMGAALATGMPAL